MNSNLKKIVVISHFKTLSVKLVTAILFIFCLNLCKAQITKPEDTTVYTFKLVLEEQDLKFQSCEFSIISALLRYKVLESNYHSPIKEVFIRHFCPGSYLFVEGRVYKAKGTLIFPGQAQFGLYDEKEYFPIINCRRFILDTDSSRIKIGID